MNFMPLFFADYMSVTTLFCRSQTTGHLRSFGEPRGLRRGAEAYRDMKECTRTIGNITVTIKQGSIATDKVNNGYLRHVRKLFL